MVHVAYVGSHFPRLYRTGIGLLGQTLSGVAPTIAPVRRDHLRPRRRIKLFQSFVGSSARQRANAKRVPFSRLVSLGNQGYQPFSPASKGSKLVSLAGRISSSIVGRSAWADTGACITTLF